MVMLVNPLQPENAELPMLVTLSGMVMLVKPLQPENAPFPILFTLLSFVIMLFLHPATKFPVDVSMMQFPKL